MTSAYVTVSPALPSALHLCLPQCLPSTLTFSSWAPAALCTHPRTGALLRGKGVLANSSFKRAQAPAEARHPSRPSLACTSGAGASHFLGEQPPPPTLLATLP